MGLLIHICYEHGRKAVPYTGLRIHPFLTRCLFYRQKASPLLFAIAGRCLSMLCHILSHKLYRCPIGHHFSGSLRDRRRHISQTNNRIRAH